jgi:hypothetical protein
MKGTELHATTVVGDTVGDPFKDSLSLLDTSRPVLVLSRHRILSPRLLTGPAVPAAPRAVASLLTHPSPDSNFPSGMWGDADATGP